MTPLVNKNSKSSAFLLATLAVTPVQASPASAREETPLGPSTQRGPGEHPASVGSSQVLLQVVLKIPLSYLSGSFTCIVATPQILWANHNVPPTIAKYN